MCSFRGFWSIAAFGAAIVAAGAVAPAQATTWNAVTDFSTTFNPNGQWSYGEGTGGNAPALFTRSTTIGNVLQPIPIDSNVQYWQSSTPSSYVPIVGENYGSSPTGCCGTIPAIPPGVLWLHPGIDDDVIVQWTAPAAGTYSFSGSFQILDTNPSGIIGEVFDNSFKIYSGVLSTFGATETFAGTVNLAANDTLQFVVNNDGLYFDDSTALTATISSTPLPSSWTMLIAGFLCLGFFAYRGTGKGSAAVAAA
jgi:hypothetical protein